MMTQRFVRPTLVPPPPCTIAALEIHSDHHYIKKTVQIFHAVPPVERKVWRVTGKQ